MDKIKFAELTREQKIRDEMKKKSETIKENAERIKILKDNLKNKKIDNEKIGEIKDEIRKLITDNKTLKLEKAELNRDLSAIKIREQKKSLKDAKFDEIRKRLEENDIKTENDVKALIDSKSQIDKLKNENEMLRKQIDKYEEMENIFSLYGIKSDSDLKECLEFVRKNSDILAI